MFDQDQNEVYMAQYSNCGTRMAPITKGFVLSTALGVCNAAAAVANSNDGPANTSPIGGGGAAESQGTGNNAQPSVSAAPTQNSAARTGEGARKAVAGMAAVLVALLLGA